MATNHPGWAKGHSNERRQSSVDGERPCVDPRQPKCLSKSSSAEYADMTRKSTVNDVVSTMARMMLIMPVVFQNEKYLVLDHNYFKSKDPMHGKGSKSCPACRKLTVMTSDRAVNVFHKYSPIDVVGSKVPDFSKPFSLFFDTTTSNCCSALPTTDGSCCSNPPAAAAGNCDRVRFDYDPYSSCKFVQYFGIDISICKYRGDVILLVEKAIEKPDSRLTMKMLECLGVKSLDDIFQRTLPDSKHVLSFTYCPQGTTKSSRDQLKDRYCIPVKGDFLVYNCSHLSSAYITNPQGEFGGRLIVEHMATMDTMAQDIGSKSTKLITPAHISNKRAATVWCNGGSIQIISLSFNCHGVSIRKESQAAGAEQA